MILEGNQRHQVLLEPQMGSREWSKTKLERWAVGRWWVLLYTLSGRAWAYPDDEKGMGGLHREMTQLDMLRQFTLVAI